MTQLHSRRAARLFRAGLVLVPAVTVVAALAAYFWSRSDGAWHVGEAAPQPIPFQHSLHAGDLGIGCRYCHGSAERSASAGMPSAHTCLTCHKEVWAGASVLEPVRSALALGQPVVWTSVSRLPDHSFFHHGAHVSKGVACETCHGRVDRMAETVKTETMSMGWCLDCHRNPAAQLRPRGAAWAMGWKGAEDGSVRAEAHYDGSDIRLLTSCSTCHR